MLVTALGNPRWVVDKASATGTTIYHDVTNRQWAEKALDGGVDGLICVNNRAGGHAGKLSPQELLAELAPSWQAADLRRRHRHARRIRSVLKPVMLAPSWAPASSPVQECMPAVITRQRSCERMKTIFVLTEKISGVPVSIIRTPYIERIGTHAGPVAKWMLGAGKPSTGCAPFIRCRRSGSSNRHRYRAVDTRTTTRPVKALPESRKSGR